MKTKHECTLCEKIVEVSSTKRAMLNKAGLPLECECGGFLSLPLPTLRGKSDSQKRSRRQEKRAAERTGGRVQPGSGSGDAKGDVRSFGSRIECKLTRAKSFSVKLAELQKLEEEAGADRPVFEFEFQGVHPFKRYVIIPGWLYDQLTSEEEE